VGSFLQQPPSPAAVRRALAFNRGSDARLAGLPPSACPYGLGEQGYLLWVQGWRDVDRFWGEDARWPCPGLPPVGGQTP
jgi:ribosome modulation factor